MLLDVLKIKEKGFRVQKKLVTPVLLCGGRKINMEGFSAHGGQPFRLRCCCEKQSKSVLIGHEASFCSAGGAECRGLSETGF